jgi:hypothetical protein
VDVGVGRDLGSVEASRRRVGTTGPRPAAWACQAGSRRRGLDDGDDHVGDLDVDDVEVEDLLRRRSSLRRCHVLKHAVLARRVVRDVKFVEGGLDPLHDRELLGVEERRREVNFHRTSLVMSR